MKHKLLLLLAAFLFSASLWAQQAPQGFSYQGIIRDQNGNALSNQTVTLLFSIKSGAPNGPVSYTEKQIGSTNEYGLVNLTIGQGGTPLQGDFSSINWGGGSKYLTVSIETSPNIFNELGSSQLMSVPYALYALNVANGGGGTTGDDWGAQSVQTNATLAGNGTAGNPLKIAQQDAQAGQVLKWNGNSWAPSNDVGSTTNGTVTQVNTGTGLTGGPITNVGTVSLASTGVTPGPYGSATQIPVLTIDAQGRITNAFTTVVQPGTIGMTGGTGIGVQQNGFNFTITNTGDTNGSDDLNLNTAFGGDVSGIFNDLQIKTGVVGSTELADLSVATADLANSSVTTVKLATGAVTANKLDNMGAANGQVLKWNGSAWAPAADNGGTTLNLTGGTGITITGTSPNLTITNSGDTNAADDLTNASTAGGDISGLFSNLQIKTDAVGANEIAANAVGNTELASDAVTTSKIANGNITGAKLDDMNAGSGQVLKWNGSSWAPANDETGTGGSFDVIAGTAISVTQNGSTFTVNNTGDTNPLDDLTTSSTANGDVSGAFSNLQLKPSVVTSTELAPNAVTSSNIIDGAVTGAKINNMGAGVGQILKWNGMTWAPANDETGTGGVGGDNWGTQVAITNATLSGAGTNASPLAIAAQGATNGQVLKFNGSSWVPGTDASNAYTAGNGISISGSAPNFTIVNTGDLSNTNEIQQLSINGAQLSLSNGGGTVTLPTSGGSGNNYSAGTGINITGTAPNLTIVNTGDLSNTNEIQQISLAGNTLSLSQGGGNVTLPAHNNYTAGAGINITGSAPNFTVINNGDLSNTNELQTVALNGTVLSLSINNSNVDLAPIISNAASFWKPVGNHIYNTNTENVLIGTNTSGSGKFQVINGGMEEAANLKSASGAAPVLRAVHNGTGAGAVLSSVGGPALVTEDGNVGIHMSNPAFQLDVNGSGHFKTSAATPQLIVENGTMDYARLSLRSNYPTGWQIEGKGSETDTDFGISLNKVSANIRMFSINGDGRITIGADVPGASNTRILHGENGLYLQNNQSLYEWEFFVNNIDGELEMYNSEFLGGTVPSGTFGIAGNYLPSDRRLKKDISPIAGGTLDKLMELKPVQYLYVSEKEGSRQSLGFLAQDLQQQFPDLVRSSHPRDAKVESYLSVNYTGLNAITIKAVQEQQGQIEQLKSENDLLRKQMEQMEARLLRMEQGAKPGGH